MQLRKTTDEHFCALYLEYAPILLRFAVKFVSPFYAEDIIQDVFLKLWDKKIFLLPEKEIKHILYAAVRNACIDELRKLSQQQEYVDKRSIQLKLDELDYIEASDELFMRKDIMDILLRKIDSLTPRSAEILRMTYVEGLKASEIAERLDISVRTVENQIYRALNQLRKSSSRLLVFLFTIV